jgi:hypothetical protein
MHVGYHKALAANVDLCFAEQRAFIRGAMAGLDVDDAEVARVSRHLTALYMDWRVRVFAPELAGNDPQGLRTPP